MCRILNNNFCEKYSCYSKSGRKSHLCPENSSNPLTEVRPPHPHSSPVANRGERCGAGTASGTSLSSAWPFICSVFYRMFGAGSPPETHKAGTALRDAALLPNPKIFFRVLNALSRSHGNVAFWLLWSDLRMLPSFQRPLLKLSLKCVCADTAGPRL